MLLFVLQVFHTLVFIAAISCLAVLWVYALTGRLARLAPWALGFPVAIFAGVMINGECVLQTWAKRLSGIEEGWARDILFLPEAVALSTIPVCVPVFAVTLLVVAARFIGPRVIARMRPPAGPSRG
ncbi:MAG: hypothetical protein ABL308_02725 [Oceanicaulis sp.]